jgi:hypothetical protein
MPYLPAYSRRQVDAARGAVRFSEDSLPFLISFSPRPICCESTGVSLALLIYPIGDYKYQPR